MKFTFLTPGTGSYYCGACMRDNTLAKSLHLDGHQVSLLPMYLPLQLDEDILPSNEPAIFFGGINIFLQQKFSIFRHTPAWFDKLLDNTRLLRSASKRSHMTSAREQGAMALAMLDIEHSHFGKEMDKLIAYLNHDRPDILCLGTALQAGMIQRIKQSIDLKVICCFQGEDSFLDDLPEPFRSNCWSALAKQATEADLLLAPSQFYAKLMRRRLGLPEQVIKVMPNGIDLDGYLPWQPAQPPTIGYFARMIREKGLSQLVDAYIQLRRELRHPDARLHIAGTITPADYSLVDQLKVRLDNANLSDQVEWSPNVSRRHKLEILSGLTLFSVPAIYPEAFGLYLVEALAAGVPVVQPRASSFPEILGDAGRLVPPECAKALACAWNELLQQPAELQRLSKNGRRVARQLYSVEAMRKRFLTLSQELTS